VEQRPGRGGVGTAAAEPGAAGARLPLRTHAVQVLPHTYIPTYIPVFANQSIIILHSDSTGVYLIFVFILMKSINYWYLIHSDEIHQLTFSF